MVVYLHIGCPKSGTTYLQEILGRNRERLAEDGILWPGQTWVDQVLAVRDLLDARPHGERPPTVSGAWQRLVDEVHAWGGHAAVISMEWLVSARPGQVRRAVEAFSPHEVRVLVTARDLARTVPAQWQESVQNWETWTWPDYLADVTSAEPEKTAAGRQLFKQHDLGRIVRRWSEAVPVERITVVTIPASGSTPGVVWDRFSQGIGLDPARYRVQQKRLSNASLGAVSSELMRRVNQATRERGMDWNEGDPILKWELAKRTLSRRRAQEPKLVLPSEHHAWTQEQSKRIIADLETLGVPVIGDLGDLVPVPQSGEPGPVTSEQLADAAVDGLAGLAMKMADAQKRTRAAEQERDATQRDPLVQWAVRARTAATTAIEQFKRRFVVVSRRSPAHQHIRATYQDIRSRTRRPGR